MSCTLSCKKSCTVQYDAIQYEMLRMEPEQKISDEELEKKITDACEKGLMEYVDSKRRGKVDESG